MRLSILLNNITHDSYVIWRDHYFLKILQENETLKFYKCRVLLEKIVITLKKKVFCKNVSI